MNRANLNQVSFSRYKKFCEANELLIAGSGGYMLTARAEHLMQSINEVIARAADLRVAVRLLNQTTRSGGQLFPTSERSFRSIDHMKLH
jgi:hypothetical protein